VFMACGPEKFRYAQDDFVLTHSGKAPVFVNGKAQPNASHIRIEYQPIRTMCQLVDIKTFPDRHSALMKS